MPTTKAVIRALSTVFPNLKPVNRTTLVKPRPIYFLEGLAVERTSYKDKFYVWSILLPIWSPTVRVHAAYSTRIGSGRFFEGSPLSLAIEISEDINSQETFRERVRGEECSPEQFLKLFEGYNWDLITLPTTLIDFGLTLALCGEGDRSLPFLLKYLGNADNESEARRSLARSIITLVQESSDQYPDIIRKYAQSAAAEWLGSSVK